MKQVLRTTLSALAIAATFIAVPAFADMMNFKAVLSATEEVPATTSKATGMIDATFDSATKKLSWKGTYADLTGKSTAAHFHGPAAKGVSAGVELAAPAPASPFEGSATLTEAQANDLLAGNIYFNIHTAANPNGEIRGQLAKAK